MWRQNTFPVKTKRSIPSIINSEEDQNVDLRDNCVSTCGREDKEVGDHFANII